MSSRPKTGSPERQKQIDNAIAHRAEIALGMKTLTFKGQRMVHAYRTIGKITLCGKGFRRAGDDAYGLHQVTCPVCGEVIENEFERQVIYQNRLWTEQGGTAELFDESPLQKRIAKKRPKAEDIEQGALFNTAAYYVDKGKDVYVG